MNVCVHATTMGAANGQVNSTTMFRLDRSIIDAYDDKSGSHTQQQKHDVAV